MAPPVASRADGMRCSPGQLRCTTTSAQKAVVAWEHDLGLYLKPKPWELKPYGWGNVGRRRPGTREDGWLPMIRCRTSFCAYGGEKEILAQKQR